MHAGRRRDIVARSSSARRERKLRGCALCAFDEGRGAQCPVQLRWRGAHVCGCVLLREPKPSESQRAWRVCFLLCVEKCYVTD